MAAQADSITVWHVTGYAVAQIILNKGFIGGWGDDGYGVYVFDDISSAEDYLVNGGWDGEGDPAQMCILEIEAPASSLWEIDVHPEWENPEFYDHVMRYPMDPDSEDPWTPVCKILPNNPNPEFI